MKMIYKKVKRTIMKNNNENILINLCIIYYLLCLILYFIIY